MNISKAHWSSEGKGIKLSMPIAKVDQERRIVSGFATLDNVDKQGDIVPSEASLSAFKKFRGNLREMHQQIAVGKVVSFKEDKYFDPETKKFYNGVYVSAYVSKGAQDTWEKVLDGTLTGFSIGGEINDAEDVYNEELDKSIRVIKDYELYELSLVDNPANQYANVISIEKNHEGGYLTKALIENVYWCGDDDLVQLSADASSDCPRCDKGMQNIGFVESNDAEKADVVKTILSRIKNEEKEVSKMAEENVETSETEVVETVEEVEKTADAPVEDVSVEKADEESTSEDAETVEESEVAEESVEESVETEKSISEEILNVTKALTETVTSTLDTLAETVKALNSKVEDLHKTISGVSQEVAGVNEEMKEVKSNFDEFGKRVDAVENDTAFRKSGDLGEIVQEEPVRVQKSLWGGRFLNKSDLFK
jgi:flagellin-like hook-associated protein FlgL